MQITNTSSMKGNWKTLKNQLKFRNLVILSWHTVENTTFEKLFICHCVSLMYIKTVIAGLFFTLTYWKEIWLWKSQSHTLRNKVMISRIIEISCSFLYPSFSNNLSQFHLSDWLIWETFTRKHNILYFAYVFRLGIKYKIRAHQYSIGCVVYVLQTTGGLPTLLST